MPRGKKTSSYTQRSETDIFPITSLLNPYQFVGSYSFSGFRSCFVVNPYDARDTADAIKAALTITDAEAESRWKVCHHSTILFMEDANYFVSRIYTIMSSPKQLKPLFLLSSPESNGLTRSIPSARQPISPCSPLLRFPSNTTKRKNACCYLASSLPWSFKTPK